MSNLFSTVQRATVFTTSMLRMAKEDPAFFSLQVMRKLPNQVKDLVSNCADKLPETLRDSFALLSDMPVTDVTSSRLTDALLVARGIEPSSEAPLKTKARFQYHLGHISEAIDLLPVGDSFRKTLEEEREILSGDVISVEPLEDSLAREQIDVLHVLVNSTPHTSSGYTVRTRAILTGQKAQGLKVAGVTRLSYPMTIGQLRFNDVDVVDGIPYFRLIAGTQPASHIERLNLHAAELSKLVARLRPRVLHATTNYANAIVAQSVARAYGIPWVYEMRGQLEKSWVARHPAHQQDEAASSESFRLMLDKETQLAQDADAVVVLSNVQKIDLIERGVNAAKIHVIANAFEPVGDVEFQAPDQARAELSLPQAFTIGTVTSIVDYEGLDTLVKAIKILRDRGYDVHGVIVGDGVSRPGLASLTKSLGLSDVIAMPGRVTREESHVWYQALDLFAIPRKKTLVCETITPIKPIEAMSNGTPVVASDLPPLRELVVDSGAGIAFEPENEFAMADAIEKFMTDNSAYDAAAKAAVANAKDHTWKRNMERYKKLYDRLFDTKAT